MRKTKYGTDSQSHIIDLCYGYINVFHIFIQKLIQTINTDCVHDKPPFKVYTFIFKIFKFYHITTKNIVLPNTKITNYLIIFKLIY